VDSELLRPGDEPVEVVERAEFGIDGFVATLWPADRPGAARVAGRGLERVVPALAVGTADRMDRRQIDDVEAELRELRELPLAAREAPPGTGEELVPAPEPRALPVRDQLEGHDRRLREALLLRREGRVEGLVDGQRLDAGERSPLEQLARQVLLARLELALQ